MTKGLSLLHRSQSSSGPSLPYHFLALSSMESSDPFSPFIVDILGEEPTPPSKGRVEWKKGKDGQKGLLRLCPLLID